MILKKNFVIFLSVLLFQFLINHLGAFEPDEVLKNSEQELRARNISKNIRCLVCQNQSIDDSNAPLAKDLRILIRKKIIKGKSDDEIYTFLSDRYGDFILLKPAFNVKTIGLWLLPFVFLLIGFLIIYNHNKKFRKS